METQEYVPRTLFERQPWLQTWKGYLSHNPHPAPPDRKQAREKEPLTGHPKRSRRETLIANKHTHTYIFMDGGDSSHRVSPHKPQASSTHSQAHKKNMHTFTHHITKKKTETHTETHSHITNTQKHIHTSKTQKHTHRNTFTHHKHTETHSYIANTQKHTQKHTHTSQTQKHTRKHKRSNGRDQPCP